jgi:hypothetical protein
MQTKFTILLAAGIFFAAATQAQNHQFNSNENPSSYNNAYRYDRLDNRHGRYDLRNDRRDRYSDRRFENRRDEYRGRPYFRQDRQDSYRESRDFHSHGNRW